MMTIQEAEQRINRMLSGDQNDLYLWKCEDREALRMAISALEKQIPKKVRVTTSTKRCSVCGRQLSGIGNIHPKRNYCQKCGQAFDWEGEA